MWFTKVGVGRYAGHAVLAVILTVCSSFAYSIESYLYLTCVSHTWVLQCGNYILSHLNNLNLCHLMCSLLARDWIKRVFSPLISQSLYRQLYFLVSSMTLFLATYGWSPLPLKVWHIDSPSLKLLSYGKLNFSSITEWGYNSLGVSILRIFCATLYW